LTSYGDVVYSATSDGELKRSERVDGHIYEYKKNLQLPGAPMVVSPAADLIYVLQNNNKIIKIDVASYSITQEFEVKDYEATALSFNAPANELWIGDKKGLVHILDATSFEQKALIEKKHNHGVSIVKTSPDGKLVASGDVYRYIYVFDAETKLEVGCYAYHTARITGLEFYKDNSLLLTMGLDLTVGVVNLATKKQKTVHRPNEKELTSSVFDD
jgi:WD40 repeat protein